MITNKSPYWVTVMADLEQEDPLFVRSHISAEFLEATCEPLFGYCDECNRVDPFCPHQTAQLSLTVTTTSVTGPEPSVKRTAGRDPCPYCGERPWWAYQDEDYGDDESDWHIDPQTGFACGRKRYG